MKVIIAGSRTITDKMQVKLYIAEALNKLLPELPNADVDVIDLELVSGGARGVDSIAEEYANEWQFKFKKFPANWDKYGKKAGYIRNVEMAEYADALIAIWDDKSKGTKMMIDIANKRGLKVFVYNLGVIK